MDPTCSRSVPRGRRTLNPRLTVAGARTRHRYSTRCPPVISRRRDTRRALLEVAARVSTRWNASTANRSGSFGHGLVPSALVPSARPTKGEPPSTVASSGAHDRSDLAESATPHVVTTGARGGVARAFVGSISDQVSRSTPGSPSSSSIPTRTRNSTPITCGAPGGYRGRTSPMLKATNDHQDERRRRPRIPSSASSAGLGIPHRR